MMRLILIIYIGIATITQRSTIYRILQQRGALGFFDGVSLRFSRKVLSSAIGWTVYEGLLMILQ